MNPCSNAVSVVSHFFFQVAASFCLIDSFLENLPTTVILFFTRRYYSATILQMSGVEDDRLAIWLASVTAFTNFIFTLVGVWLVEKVGRRKLTFGSLAGRWLDVESCFKMPSSGDSDSLSIGNSGI